MMQDILLHMSTRLACGTFFGLPPWNQYIPGSNGGCGDINLTPDQLIPAIPLIGLAVLEMLLRIAGIAAVIYVIYGGIQYVVSQGSPDATRAAQSTIINALIGMVIAIIAINVVAFVGRTLGA